VYLLHEPSRKWAVKKNGDMKIGNIKFWGVGFFAALFAVTAGIASAQETAYAAMRVVSAEKGSGILDKLVEVRGKDGGPQPEAWTLLFNDPSARGGVREIVVQEGAILSERTPLGGFSGVGDLPVLPAARLNLDSDGAFRIAEQEAQRKGIGFHWLNYTLRFDATAGEGPLWILQLIDYSRANVGTIVISAETLHVVRGLGETRAPQSADFSEAPAAPESANVFTGSEPEPRGGILGTAEQFGVNLGLRAQDTAKRASDSLRNAAESVRDTFTGGEN
jgi:hypothetical protein